MRVNKEITKAQKTGLFAKGISIGTHPGMFCGVPAGVRGCATHLDSLNMTTVRLVELDTRLSK